MSEETRNDAAMSEELDGMAAPVLDAGIERDLIPTEERADPASMDAGSLPQFAPFLHPVVEAPVVRTPNFADAMLFLVDRKSTRLNSSH